MKRRDLPREYYVVPIKDKVYRAKWRQPIEYTYYKNPIIDLFRKNKRIIVEVEYEEGFLEELIELGYGAIREFETVEDAQKYIDIYLSTVDKSRLEREEILEYQAANPPIRYK